MPRIAVGVEYTDNVFLTKNNTEDDFIYSVSPGFTGQLLGRTSGLEVSYDPSYVTYQNNSRNDLWRHSANLQGWADLSARTRLDIQDSFFLTEDPLPDSDVAVSPDPDPIQPPNTTVREGRRKYYTNAARAGLRHTFGEEDFISLAYTYRILDNDDDMFYEDSESHIPVVAMQYWFDPEWGMGAVGRYTRGLYKQDNDFIGIPSDDFDEWYGSLRGIHRFDSQWDGFIQYEHTYRQWDNSAQFNDDFVVYNPSLGANYIMTDLTSASLKIGYFYREIVDDRGEENDDNSGPTGFASLQHNIEEGKDLFVFVGGGYASSDFSSQSLGFNKFYNGGATLTHEFNRDISGDVFGSYRWSKYLDTDPKRIDEFARIGTGLNYVHQTWLAIRLAYSFRKFWSDESPGYSENRVSFSIKLQPERPLRW